MSKHPDYLAKDSMLSWVSNEGTLDDNSKYNLCHVS